MGKMTFQIKAKNKDDLVAYFRKWADELELRASTALLQKQKLSLQSEARGWRDAAECLDETTFSDYELSNPE